jgi:tetratricopeptide (TPR) repeat protein
VATAVVLGGSISWLLSGGGGRRPATPTLPSRTMAVIEPLRPSAGTSFGRQTEAGPDPAPAPRPPNPTGQGTLGRRRVDELNRRAIDAYEALDPRTALRLLEQALRRSESLGPRGQDLVARTHANLGLVYAAGFKDRELAARHFRRARAVAPDITPPSALMTPEVEAALKASGQ